MARSNRGAPKASAVRSRSAEVLGGKWKLILLYYLLTGAQRNGELRHLVPRIAQKMLTQHLRELERDEIVVRTVHHEVPPKVVTQSNGAKLSPKDADQGHVRLGYLLGLSHGRCDRTPSDEAQATEGVM